MKKNNFHEQNKKDSKEKKTKTSIFGLEETKFEGKKTVEQSRNNKITGKKRGKGDVKEKLDRSASIGRRRCAQWDVLRSQGCTNLPR